MSSSGSRAKRDRERMRDERSARKRARRLELATTAEPTSGDDGGPRRAESDVLGELAALHQQFEEGAMGFDEFEAKKDELIGDLDVG